MHLLLLALGGMGILAFLKQRQSGLTPLPPGAVAPNSTTGAQPSQTYPYKPTQAARADNANQPWYNNGKAAVSSGPVNDISGMQQFAKDVGAAGSVIHSLSSVWGDLSNVFGGNDPKQNLASTDSMPSMPNVFSAYTPDQSMFSGWESDFGGTSLSEEYGNVDYSSIA